jgi:hypothetical protein
LTPWRKRAAVAGAGVEELGPDAGVAAYAVADAVDVGTNGVAEAAISFMKEMRIASHGVGHIVGDLSAGGVHPHDLVGADVGKPHERSGPRCKQRVITSPLGNPPVGPI